jgi:hypothetical protein
MMSVCCYPGVSLAEPRFTPGFMLSPASQADLKPKPIERFLLKTNIF